MMERLSWSRALVEVVHRDALKIDPHHGPIFGITDALYLTARRRTVQRVDARWRTNNDCFGLLETVDHHAVEVIRVGVGDNNQVCCRKASVITHTPRIHMNDP